MNSKSTINLSLREATHLLTQAEFIFAKTMPKHPHWYTLREAWGSPLLFEAVVRFIRRYGYVEYFKGKPFTMFNLNGYKYWTMGAPVDDTILINRTNIGIYKPEYDDIAVKYTKMFQDEESKKENEALFALLDIKGRVLDVGCGTGLLLEYIKPEDYLGIDPSSMMLQQLALNHPDYAKKVLCCAAEDFYLEKFDTIVALFGTASYFNPSVIQRFREMLTEGGKIYFMYYKEEYQPITHIVTGINPKMYPNDEVGILFHNYKIVTYENIR